MHINHSPKESTIEISSKSAEPLELGNAFIRGDKFAISAEKSSKRFYPEAFERLVFLPAKESKAQLTITVDGQQLVLSGGIEMAKKGGPIDFKLF
ncbi:hypothetical protein [Pedosphaera parvula]|uniref:hypothetical protein n=1 Tax=Pedosphaera parvula TaxID=1032527 RepID=UPI00058F2D2E|nr:hypothetical protein [Pedosphaera parvula]